MPRIMDDEEWTPHTWEGEMERAQLWAVVSLVLWGWLIGSILFCGWLGLWTYMEEGELRIFSQTTPSYQAQQTQEVTK
jgi:hypothetical protein